MSLVFDNYTMFLDYADSLRVYLVVANPDPPLFYLLLNEDNCYFEELGNLNPVFLPLEGGSGRSLEAQYLPPC